MKRTLSLTLGLVCLFISAYCQTSTQTIKGIVVDSAKNQSLSYVTVSLRNATTKQPVKSTLSKDNGSFQFDGLPLKGYQLVLASVGYKQVTIAIDSTKKLVDLGHIKMVASSSSLKEVSVTALKPIVKQEADRISYDVQADPDSKIVNVLDMLRKTPLISVDANDNITLKGNSDYKILINNKPSALVAHNPSDVFKAMPAANIERIEVITTPPAKYDAEGVAGIINIITKRNTDQGYNGNLNSRYSTVYGGGASGNITVKQGKFGVVGYVGFNKQRKLETMSDREQNFLATNSVFNQNSLNTSHNKSVYSSAELSYEIDTLNLITGEFNYYKGDYSFGGMQRSIQRDASQIIIQQFNSATDSYDNWHGLDLGINYQLGFKRNKQQLLTFSYKYNYSPDKSFSSINIDDIVDYPIPSYQQFNESGNKEQTIQSDYVHPYKNFNFEGGVKAILRKNFSNFTNDIFDANSGQFVLDPSQTNDFDYQQNVYSIYNSYQLKLKKWSFKGGLRLEHTTVNANFVSSGTAADQDYNNFIPTVSIQRSLKGSSVSFGYTDRISRPGIWSLNPFIDRSNPRFISQGNPDLRPVTYHTVNVNYSKFGKVNVNAGLSYNFANNTIQNISTLQGDTLTFTTYQNIGKTRSGTLNLNLSYPVNTKLNLSLSLYASYVKLTGTYNNIFYSNDGVQANAYFNASYKVSDWRFGINAYGYTPYISLQGKSNPYFSSSYSVSRDLFKKKLTLSLAANNPYSKYLTTKSTTNSPDFTQVSHYRNYYANYMVTLNYKFGKLTSSIKKNQRGISNDDSSGGKSSQ